MRAVRELDRRQGLTGHARAGRLWTVPPQNPVTRLQQVAVDVGRFADALETSTDLDARLLRFWQAELSDIAATLAGAVPDAEDGTAAPA